MLLAATVPQLLRHLADATEVSEGLAQMLAQLGRDLEAERVALEFADGRTRNIAWRAEGAGASVGASAGARTAGGAAAVPLAQPLLLAVTAAGQGLASLLVHRERPFDSDEQTLLQSVADLCAVALAREAHRRDLEAQVSDRMREVAQQRAFIECIVDSLPHGLYVVDRDYRIHAWNRKRETGMQGVSRIDAVGRSIFEILHRQPAGLLKREFDEVFANGQLQQFQMESNAFGDMRTYRISKIPMRLGGGAVTHVITIGEDITDWKAALDRTAQAEKLAALGQLAAGVMHEINNPLATIAACAESLSLSGELGDAAPPSGELLRIIDLEVQRCKKIVNGLLDFSRPKAVGRELFDLNAVVQQGLFLLQHHPRFKRIKLVTDLETSVPLLVEGDSDQLVQVLIALAMNALDATPEQGHVTIRTRADHDDAGRRMAQLDVEDEGPGVPRALQAKVFEPFFTTKPPGQGTGLGLAICYGIVSDHGGTLALVSPEGQGATFRVSLPLRSADAGELRA